MPDKSTFLASITKETVLDEAFFKKAYGYSVCDDLFLGMVAVKLASIGRKEAVQAYNEWYAAWKMEDDRQMKKVAEWFHKELDIQFREWVKNHREKVVQEWKLKEIELLQKKKTLLLTKKLKQLTKS
jgi:hypothetical protein